MVPIRLIPSKHTWRIFSLKRQKEDIVSALKSLQGSQASQGRKGCNKEDQDPPHYSLRKYRQDPALEGRKLLTKKKINQFKKGRIIRFREISVNCL